MGESIDQDFQGASEIGKIFHSFMDKKLLCSFFLDSVINFVQASKAHLYLAGKDEQIWLEGSSNADAEPGAEFKTRVEELFKKGQPSKEPGVMFVPLIAQNKELGIATFHKEVESDEFTEREQALAVDLTYQVAGALQNILLFEENLKMERLAAVGKTTSVVMHELTNILQLAKLADECLRRGFDQNNEKYLNRGMAGIQKALKEMDGFAYEMLSLTKDYKIKPVPINLPELLAELEQDLADKTRQANVTFTAGCQDGLVEVLGEPRSLYRALLNMVKNAIEAADKDDAYIKITAKSLTVESYEIRVEDNGMGMNEETRAQIFQTFFTTKGEKGTGLGLMIIERTIKAHGGEIQLESEAGKGTTFILTFPKQLAP